MAQHPITHVPHVRRPRLEVRIIHRGKLRGGGFDGVVPGSFGWSDLGSWTTAYELASKDEQGNATRAEAVMVDSTGCYVSAPSGKLVALVGVHDLVVVETEDALLVMPRERAQDVRAVVDELKARRDPRA